MISINTNLSSLIAQQSLKQSSNKLNLAVERMSTGFKINHAKDNAANYSISTNMTTKIGAYQVAEDNVAMGLDLLSTANGSLDQISDKLSRLRALAEQSANGTYGGGKSKLAINAEANSLVDEIERLYNTTEYNGINLSKGKIETSNFIKDIERRDTSEMTTLESVDETVALTTGTYSISTAEGLAKLATMTNNGLIGTDTEFVLANDIDLKEWCEANSATGGWIPIGYYNDDGDYTKTFRGVFDGNGFSILNLYINRSDANNQGLFGMLANTSIYNVAIVDFNINAYSYAGALSGGGVSTFVQNCFSTNGYVTLNCDDGGGLLGTAYFSDVSLCYSNNTYLEHLSNTGYILGGLIGSAQNSFISTCFSANKVKGCNQIGGFIANAQKAQVENSFSDGEVYSKLYTSRQIGAFIGFSGEGEIINCYSNTKINGGNGASFIGDTGYTNNRFCLIKNCYYNSKENEGREAILLKSPQLQVENLSILNNNILPFTISNNAMVSSYEENAEIGLQVGTKGDWASALSVELGYRLDGISALRNIGIGNEDYLSKVDTLINSISAKAVEFGAAQNRLESALDEISAQYENLVSSRSTLRDADISEVSSEYIRQQILQEASATLLATANQNPAIALQLL